ncbi:MAG: AI-2E family transporter [Bacteroidota bacterium]
MARSSRPTALRALLTVAAFVIVVAGMQAAASILVPLLLAVFLAILCAPSLFWLQGHGWRTTPAVLLIVFALLAVSAAVGTLLGTSLVDFTSQVPVYQARLRVDLREFIEQSALADIEGFDISIVDSFDPGALMAGVATLLTGLGNIVTRWFLIILLTVFMLLELSGFPSKLKAAFHDSGRSMVYVQRFTASVKKYLAIKAIVSVATGVMAGVWLALIGVDYPVLWGVVAFLLNFIPTIGSIVAAGPPLLLALVQTGWVTAALVAFGYLTINTVVGNIIEPRWLGQGVGLSTFVVFLSLLFWGYVLGTAGMLLAVPLTMIAKLALESSDETNWLAILLSHDVPEGALPENGVATDTERLAAAPIRVATPERLPEAGDGGPTLPDIEEVRR